MSIVENSAALSAFQNRNYAMYTAGNTFSLIGMWAQRVAVGVLMWKLTESPWWLSTLAFAEAAPIILLTPLGGVIADLYDQRKTLLICLTISCLQAFMLCFLTIIDAITPQWIFSLTLLAGITFAINQTARLTLVAKMVPRELLNPAIALTAVIFNIARFIGPLIGGWIVAEFGFAAAFGFNGVSFFGILAALVLLELTPFRPRERMNEHPFKAFVSDFVEGCRYTFTHASIGSIILTVAIGAVLVQPFSEFFAGIADLIFNLGNEGRFSIEQGVAWLLASMGVGSILCGLWLANRSDVQFLRRLIVPAVLVNAICVILFVLSPNFWFAVIVVGLAGMAQTVCGTGSQSLVQNDVEEEMRGRVISLWSIAMRGGPALGALVLGAFAELAGFTYPLIAAGILALMIVGFLSNRQRIPAEPAPTQEL